ncbi:SIN3 binding protein, partial [Scheffersomyces stipitis CBS 6054]
MDFYYRKSMGNGTVASKFRLNSIQLNQSNMQKVAENKAANNSNVERTQESKTDYPADNYPIESPETHHPSNCIRCYRLKKKCSRQYPKCSTCTKGHFDCEYVTRSNKRKRRKKADLNNLENTIDLTQNKATGKDGNVDKSVVAHKLVSVSSLLTDETPDPSKLVSTHESSRPRKVPSAALSSMARRTREHNESLAEKSTKKLFHPLKTNLNDDFITVLPMKNYISATFVYNYFENFGSKYPFVNKEEFMQRFVKIDFNKEAIVNLDIYMVMSIGCIIYDSYSNVSLFDKFFKESIIESIVDGLDFTFNGQNSEKEELQNLELITLLTIYSIASLNKQNCWALVGVLNRLALQLDLYKATDNVRKQRLFWSIHNIEMELSLLLNKPAQTPQDKFITLDYPLKNKYFKCEEEVLLSHEIWYAKIQEKILVLQLSNDDDKQKLVTLSSEIEKWRVGISGVVHRVYRESSLLKNYTDLINLNYYYLLVELDQLSPNKSFQFTLQFVSNSFSILTSNAEVEIDNEDQNSGSKKPVVRLSLASSLFWYKKLFKVVRFNMDSLSRMIASTTTVKFDFGIKLNEFRSNISLITNLLKYV